MVTPGDPLLGLPEAYGEAPEQKSAPPMLHRTPSPRLGPKRAAMRESERRAAGHVAASRAEAMRREQEAEVARTWAAREADLAKAAVREASLRHAAEAEAKRDVGSTERMLTRCISPGGLLWQAIALSALASGPDSQAPASSSSARR